MREVSDSFYKRDPKEISVVREKYNLQNFKYLLFVSTIQPRKKYTLYDSGPMLKQYT
ncbi:MAG: hypothetical protein KatS3mg101_0353 [Patescibacteria group bacterium]|nr:MAG: hypothetical protein KatS3mg101_0353 [Patescibacteria group bacterium]